MWSSEDNKLTIPCEKYRKDLLKRFLLNERPELKEGLMIKYESTSVYIPTGSCDRQESVSH